MGEIAKRETSMMADGGAPGKPTELIVILDRS